jgi:hypothetical protein
MLPLQMGIPGGPELVILFLIFLILFIVPVGLLVLAVVYYFVWRDDDEA